ncbi:D-alanyl-D-alanine carboxypeptidase [Rhodobacteraceae bacterium MCCB 386]|nr:D-alanyl-D-alanine carboxypeptidase [Roseitranquillus sediminis]
MQHTHSGFRHPAAAVLVLAFGLLTLAVPALAAPHAAFVMDARSGEVYHQENADARLHPASLTKMMTLYIAFEAAERDEIDLEEETFVSANAASEPPSRLGLSEGQRIKLVHLVRATAVKSANDAATALGEAISGSEEAFVERMNATAAALGMSGTSFRNAHGLTEEGHLSTARDMSILGRQLFFDFPAYYNLFSRQTADAGMAQVGHTNGRFLRDYPGADGIKTGYTRAAGYNLTASAERDGERLIVTLLGGASTVARNAKVAQLMDAGFAAAPSVVAVDAPPKPRYATRHLMVARGSAFGTVPQDLAGPGSFFAATPGLPAAPGGTPAVVAPAAAAAPRGGVGLAGLGGPADPYIARLR